MNGWLDVSSRTLRLKKELLSSPYELCVERIRYLTEIYKESTTDPEIIKRAKAIAHVLRKMTIYIRADELLVGNETGKNLAEKFNYDLYAYRGYNKRRYRRLGKRKVQPFQITEPEVEEALELLEFWKGKALYDNIIYRKLVEDGILTGHHQFASYTPNIAIQIGTNEGHICAGYEKLLRLGYTGIIEEAEAHQRQLDVKAEEFERENDFYEAVKIYYKAAIEFALRHADVARKLALKEEDSKRKEELEKIAQIMQNIAEKPPASFYEAIQFIWFSQNIANIIYYRSVVALGRLDQILWPYYEADLKANEITREFALELIEELNLKLTWNVTFLPDEFTAFANALGQNTQTITVGGVDLEGLDATNELSFLFLEAYKNIKVLTTDLSVRIHQNTPKEFFLEAIKVFQYTTGIAFYNDEVIIPALEKAGYSAGDARDYVMVGCVEPTGQGNNFSATGRMFLNLPGVLELVLNNGFSHMSKQIDSLKTGPPEEMLTFDQFMTAFTQQLRYNLKKCVEVAEVADALVMEYFEVPFISATLDGCMENGLDYTRGGAKYNFSSITAYGFATLVDSLYVIKKRVYEEQKMTIRELIEILNSNFKDHEAFQQSLVNKYDKWGNDKEEIDLFAVELWDLFCHEVAKHKPSRGGRYNPGAYSMGVHVIEGVFTQPSADGRRARKPISNSLSPVNRVEKNGITAVLKSIAKLNYDLATNGVAVNIRLHPQNFQGDENLEKFQHLLQTYFNLGGMQIQPTVVSTETLKDAQKHPENYPDLIIKVGGYNATFVDLGAPIQNEIIDRLEYRF
jgi:pyruvate formate-lyase/glycerol dehydratase family glycyl radical enzyme